MGLALVQHIKSVCCQAPAGPCAAEWMA